MVGAQRVRCGGGPGTGCIAKTMQRDSIGLKLKSIMGHTTCVVRYLFLIAIVVYNTIQKIVF